MRLLLPFCFLVVAGVSCAGAAANDATNPATTGARESDSGAQSVGTAAPPARVMFNWSNADLDDVFQALKTVTGKSVTIDPEARSP